MKSFALIIAMWVLAILTIVLLQHKPANGGTPIVKASMATATFVCTPAIAPRLQRRNREIA